MLYEAIVISARSRAFVFSAVTLARAVDIESGVENEMAI
jgi:hypothetical protein